LLQLSCQKCQVRPKTLTPYFQSHIIDGKLQNHYLFNQDA